MPEDRAALVLNVVLVAEDLVALALDVVIQTVNVIISYCISLINVRAVNSKI